MEPSVIYLDDLWCNVIRLMYSYKCAKCGKEGHDCHHVITRSDKRHRWHPLNGVFLCHECHDWAHSHPILFKKWLKRNLLAVWEHTRRPNAHGFDPKDRSTIKIALLKYKALLEDTASGKIRRHRPVKEGNTGIGLSLAMNIVIGILLIIWIMCAESSP